MKNVIILGSRTFAPLDQVRDDIRALSPDVAVYGVGKADLVTAASEVAMDFHAIQVTTDRAPILEAARRPSSVVWAYAARDPETKETTEGTQQLIDWLTSEGITVDVRRSELTAVQALAYHHLETELEKLIASPANRRRYRENRCYTAGVALHRIHEAVYRWLESNDSDPQLLARARTNYLADRTDDELTAELNDGADAWIRNLKRYELMSRLLIRTKALVALPALSGSAEAMAA